MIFYLLYRCCIDFHDSQKPINVRGKTIQYQGENFSTSYLYQWVPVSYWFTWVSQHFIPVISSKAFGINSCPAYSNDLIVPYSENCRVRKNLFLIKNSFNNI